MNSLIQFRANEVDKIKATNICERLGIDLPTYMRICLARLIQENGIPFSMKLDEASNISEQYGNSDMTLDGINKEIQEVRK